MRSRRSESVAALPSFEPLESRRLFDTAHFAPEIFNGERRPIRAVVAADFDGDGDQDIAGWAGRGGGRFPARSVLLLLTNDGTGQFELAARHPMRLDAGKMTAGDFDGDGIAELATISPSRTGSGTAFRVFGFDPAGGALELVTRRGFVDPILQIETLPSGQHPDRLLFIQSHSSDGLPDSIRGVVILLESNSPTPVHTIFDVNDARLDGVRIVDADGDDFHDVLAAFRPLPKTPDAAQVTVRVYRHDASSPGVFDSGAELLTYQSDLPAVPVLTDANADGHPDVVYISERMYDDDRVLLRVSDGNGGFGDPQLLLRRDSDFPLEVDHALYGSGTGPTGKFEIWISEQVYRGGRTPEYSSSLVRLVRRDDGGFDPRIAFAVEPQMYNRAPPGIYLVAQLTPDSFPDLVSVGQGVSDADRNRAIKVVTFDGSNHPPVIIQARASVAYPGSGQSVTVGQRVSLYARIFDSEQEIGEPGGFPSGAFYLDTNHNGIIDSGDFLLSEQTYSIIPVAADWPLGTFDVLVQVTDAGGLTTTALTELPLTIV